MVCTKFFIFSFKQSHAISLQAYMNRTLFLLKMACFPKCTIFRQHLYDKITLKLLGIPFLRNVILNYHIILFYNRYYTMLFFTHIEKYINLQAFAIIVSMICSRLHIAGSMIVICLLVLRIDFAVLSMARFYQKRPDLLHRNFPQITLNRRGMWTRATQIASEAIQNPNVITVGTAVVGALVWKALDVYDTQTQKEIADSDRIAENQRATADRIAENQRTELNRIEENKRNAFEKLNSKDFEELSSEQQERVKNTVKTGKITV